MSKKRNLIKEVTSAKSTSRSQSLTVVIDKLKQVNSVSVNTGSVSHDVIGEEITISVSGGSRVDYDTESQYFSGMTSSTVDGWPGSLSQYVYGYEVIQQYFDDEPNPTIPGWEGRLSYYLKEITEYKNFTGQSGPTVSGWTGTLTPEIESQWFTEQKSSTVQGWTGKLTRYIYKEAGTEQDCEWYSAKHYIRKYKYQWRWNGSSWVAHNSLEYEFNGTSFRHTSGGRSGTVTRTGATSTTTETHSGYPPAPGASIGQIWSDRTVTTWVTFHGNLCKTVNTPIEYRYQGTLTRIKPNSYSGQLSRKTEVGRYRGYLQKDGDPIYRYQGTLTRVIRNYYQYVVTINYDLKGVDLTVLINGSPRKAYDGWVMVEGIARDIEMLNMKVDDEIKEGS